MATKLANLELERAHFENFKSYIPGFSSMDDFTVGQLMDMGLIQVSTAYEQAIANCGNLTVVSEDGYDFSDGSDAKLSSVRTSSYGRHYSAPVTSIKNKTGSLRVQVYERKHDKFYYFVIPHWAHSQVSITSNIEIAFELDGTPRRNSVPGKRRGGLAPLPAWWQFEVGSFQEMSM